MLPGRDASVIERRLYYVAFEVTVFLFLLLSFGQFVADVRWERNLGDDSILVTLLTCSAFISACAVAMETSVGRLWSDLLLTAMRMSFIAAIIAIPLCSAYAVVDKVDLDQVTGLLGIAIPLMAFSALSVGFIASWLPTIGGLRRRVALVGDQAFFERVRDFAIRGPKALSIVGFLELDSDLSEQSPACQENLERVGHLPAFVSRTRAEELVVGVREPHASHRSKVGLPIWSLLELKTKGVRVTDFPTFWARQTGEIDLESLDPASLVFRTVPAYRPMFQLGKRAFDIVCSIGLLVLTLPITIVSAFLIKLSSPGPVLFRQDRVGLGGQTFTVIKFRTMYTDAEDGSGPIWARENDPRITPCGAFLRRSRVDELPQLLNVLKGEMSIIGPRPERPHFVSMLRQTQPCYTIRHHVKPGLTGWAQVSQGYASSLDESAKKLSYDIYYVIHGSVLLELIIMLRTIGVILFGENAR